MEFQQSSRKSSIKEWKIHGVLFETEEQLKPGLGLKLSIRREVPVFEGKHGDWEGDERIRVHIERGSLHIHWTWPEARHLLTMLTAGAMSIGEVADACEQKFEERTRKRQEEKAAREKVWRESRDNGFESGYRGRYRHTGKTARQKQKAKDKLKA